MDDIIVFFFTLLWFIVLTVWVLNILMALLTDDTGNNLSAMNSEEREQLVEIVKQSNEVILGEVPFHDTDSTIVTPELNLNEIVVAHVKSQCPECGKYLANVNEHMKLVHLKIRYVFSVTFQ